MNTIHAKLTKEAILNRVGELVDMSDVATGMEITISIGKNVIPTISYKVEGFPVIPDQRERRGKNE